MSPAALAGFSAAWALFTSVLPTADSMDPADVAAAARAIDLPQGSLPNGSGLRFGAPGSPDAGYNLAAASVIWEWVAPGQAAVSGRPPSPPRRSIRATRTPGEPPSRPRGGAGRGGRVRGPGDLLRASLAARQGTSPGRHRPAAGLPMGEPSRRSGRDQPTSFARGVPHPSRSEGFASGGLRHLRQPGDDRGALEGVRRQEGQIEVLLSVDPVGPATLASPRRVVRLRERVPARGLLPALRRSGLPRPAYGSHPDLPRDDEPARGHAPAFTSPDGTAWQEQEGSDSLAAQQAEGPMPELGTCRSAGRAAPRSRRALRGRRRFEDYGDRADRGAACLGLVGFVCCSGSRAAAGLRRTQPQASTISEYG